MAGMDGSKMASGKDARTYERLVSFVCPHCRKRRKGTRLRLLDVRGKAVVRCLNCMPKPWAICDSCGNRIRKRDAAYRIYSSYVCQRCDDWHEEHPKEVLQALCDQAGIEMTDKMVEHWCKGRKGKKDAKDRTA